jgi:molybdopterin-biosynthesis enzyme MoeA-like protein
MRMARVPEGAELIRNKVSGAPGIRHGNVFILPGVPYITAAMLDSLAGTLEGGLPMLSRTIGCWTAESEVADLLRETEKVHDRCQIGSYPHFREGRFGSNFVIRSVDQSALDACAEDLAGQLEAAGLKVVRGEI